MSNALMFSNILEDFDIKIEKYFDYEKATIKEILKSNPTVSFSLDGEPLSFWNDDFWDFNIFSKNKNEGLINLSIYKNKLNYDLFQEFKLLVLVFGLKKFEKTSRIKTIKDLTSSVFVFFETAQSLNLNTIEKFNNKDVFIKVLELINGKYSYGTLINKLSDLRNFENIKLKAIELNIGLSQKNNIFQSSNFSIENISKKYAKETKKEKQQTLYIPSRIHSEIVMNAIETIKRNLKDINKIENFIEQDYLEYEKAISKTENNEHLTFKKDVDLKNKASSIRKNKTSNILSSSDLLKSLKLNKRFKNVGELKRECQLISTSSIILLLTFTGMRINEILNIKKDGYKVLNTEPKLHIVRSFETKISGGQTVDYITSPIIKDVFDMLIKVQSSTIKYDKNIEDKNSLIISSKHQKLMSYGDKSQIRKNLIKFIETFDIKLQNEDIKEHNLLNKQYGKNIKIGDYWKIGSHQFRRTLIVNFVSHNLSSINEIKQQVKHMYATMTEYYAKNSELIQYFNLKQPTEIFDSIQDEILNDNVRQYKDFYYSNNKLSGNKGNKILEERKITSVLSDEDIKLMFKTGAYKLTKSPYGYCTKGNDCDKMGVVDPTFCGASCDTMIITKENAEQWKKLYIRNNKLLNMKSSDLLVGEINMGGALTMLEAQNQVAKKILTEFGIEV